MSLLKIQLTEELRLGAIGRDGNRDAMTYIVSVLFIAAVFGSMMYLFMDGLIQTGYGERVPVISAFVSLTVALVLSFYRGTHAFVFDEYDQVMSMPVRPIHVAMARFISVYVVAAAAAVFLSAMAAVPMIDAYGPLSTAAFLVAVLIGALLPASVGAAAGTVFRRIGSGSSHSGYVSIAVLVAAVALVVVLMRYMSVGIGTDVPDIISDIASVYCPPARWIAGASGSDLGDWLSVVVSASVSSAIVVGAASRCLMGLNSEARPRQSKAGRPETRVSGRLWALYRRDGRRYVTSRIYITNTAVGMLLLVVLSYLIAYTDTDDTLEDLSQIMPLISGILPFFVSIFVGMSSTTAVSLSLEGRTRWILGTAPLRPWDIFLPKILLNLTVILPLEFVSIALLSTGLGVTGTDLALLIAVPTAYALLIPALSMSMNVRFPRYDWTSEYYAVKGGSVSMLGSLGLGLASVLVPLLVSIVFDGCSDAIMAVTTIAVLAVAAVLYRRLTKCRLYLY